MRQAIVLREPCRVFDASQETSNLVGELRRGERVRVVEPGTPWVRASSDRAEGFIRAADLAMVDPSESGRFLAADATLEEAAVELPSDERLGPASNATPRERAVLRAWNLYGGLLRLLADRTGIDPAAAVAVVCVESSGHGFGPDGRVIIRFENHIFHRRMPQHLGDRFARHFGIRGEQPWLGHVFRASPGEPWAPFHGSQEREWRVFEFASGLDERAAHYAISMGLPQIMGFNHELIGFDRPQAMLAYFEADVRYQLLSMFDFVGGLRSDAPALRALRRSDYEAFAALYNGPGQARYYGELIRAHVADFRRATARVGRDTGTATGGTNAAGTNAGSDSAAAGSEESRRYEVRAGDTLGAIAGRFGVTIDAIARINGIADVNLIRVGQILRVPAAEPAPAPPVVPSVPPEEVSSEGSERRLYVVQRGDTLGAIARRHDTTVEALAQANEIANPDRIFAGQVLTIVGAGEA